MDAFFYFSFNDCILKNKYNIIIPFILIKYIMKQFLIILLALFLASCSSRSRRERELMELTDNIKTKSSYVVESLADGSIKPIDYHRSSSLKFRFYNVGDTIIVEHTIITGKDKVTSTNRIHGFKHPNVSYTDHSFTLTDSTENYHSHSVYERGVIRAYSIKPNYY